MKVYLILLLVILVITLVIVIWGALTNWKFIKDTNMEKYNGKEGSIILKLLQQGIEDNKEYKSLGNKLGAYFIGDEFLPNYSWDQAWCGCFSSGDCTHTRIKDYIKHINKALPKISEELAKIKQNLDVKNDAVIHIRCSDVPFIPHHSYHLQPKEYYQWVAAKCRKENIKGIHFLLCTNHNNKEKLTHKCTQFAEIIRNWMTEFLPDNVKIHPISCLSILQSFKLFIGCKLLIQGGACPSSFSFFPGLIKGKNFLTPRMAREDSLMSNNLFKEYINKLPWSMWTGDPIWHSEVNDYLTFDYDNKEK